VPGVGDVPAGGTLEVFFDATGGSGGSSTLDAFSVGIGAIAGGSANWAREPI
jgi:hypothetical protein